MQEAFKDSAGPADESCDSRVLLNQIAPGCEDKLHNKIKEILWRGANYAIYCSDKGIYVHFSDCKEEEEDRNPASKPRSSRSRRLQWQFGGSPMTIRSATGSSPYLPEFFLS